MKTNKYAVIGSETQVAATEAKSNIALARRVFKSAKFSNDRPALVVHECATLRDAMIWLERSNNALAFVSGRLGRWMTPSFTIVKR